MVLRPHSGVKLTPGCVSATALISLWVKVVGKQAPENLRRNTEAVRTYPHDRSQVSFSDYASVQLTHFACKQCRGQGDR
ncbi:hypothetical protein MYCTH_2309543 [Thermothelomyces thermophilus ATCC 42464]|uniref:Uncharacterized protein n=1 Tax=Thermothelomyces thermophilus (strain ATCC 42464 / BCRC 31852 / DSM 1799) TaxID=573729 RepID=G2QIP5_THET4|nr:uncharacterized protein MYCTH_2309543 [Thermothelomyces thermophilus ATCC 42464]AEO60367.1 hypothetical protein MYCTH_2309543 [Thermothelomyces thermophilus ATCC 42464]